MAKKSKSAQVFVVWGLMRISLGLIFLWAFFDKVFGLGLSTCRDAKSGVVEVMCSQAWLNGGSPTTGFLKFGTDGPLAEFYKGMIGNGFVDWLFMLGLLLIGSALILGIGVRIAVVTGSALLLMMWLAVLPPEHHPFLDDHIVYILILAGVYMTNQNQRLGLRNWWVNQRLVQRLPILE